MLMDLNLFFQNVFRLIVLKFSFLCTFPTAIVLVNHPQNRNTPLRRLQREALSLQKSYSSVCVHLSPPSEGGASNTQSAVQVSLLRTLLAISFVSFPLPYARSEPFSSPWTSNKSNIIRLYLYVCVWVRVHVTVFQIVQTKSVLVREFEGGKLHFPLLFAKVEDIFSDFPTCCQLLNSLSFEKSLLKTVETVITSRVSKMLSLNQDWNEVHQLMDRLCNPNLLDGENSAPLFEFERRSKKYQTICFRNVHKLSS